jgi:hypothetical protein
MGLQLPVLRANGTRQPPQPFGFGAAHFALEAFRVKRLHSSARLGHAL